MRCKATARPESLHAMTVAAGWHWAISLARLGPEITATCAGSAPVTEMMTWLIRIRVPSSMPLARLTSVAPSCNNPSKAFHCSRLARSICAGTPSSTVDAPCSASSASAVARMAGGNERSGQVVRVVAGGIDLLGDFGSPRPQRHSFWPARLGEHLGQSRAPCAGTHHRDGASRAGHLAPPSVVERSLHRLAGACSH